MRAYVWIGCVAVSVCGVACGDDRRAVANNALVGVVDAGDTLGTEDHVDHTADQTQPTTADASLGTADASGVSSTDLVTEQTSSVDPESPSPDAGETTSSNPSTSQSSSSGVSSQGSDTVITSNGESTSTTDATASSTVVTASSTVVTTGVGTTNSDNSLATSTSGEPNQSTSSEADVDSTSQSTDASLPDPTETGTPDASESLEQDGGATQGSDSVEVTDPDAATVEGDAEPGPTNPEGSSDGGSLDAGDVLLTSLEVTGGRYPLKPAFDPAIKRYSVVATSNSAVLSLNASAGALPTIDVNGDEVPAGETLSLTDVAPGSDVKIRVGVGDASTEYLIRYLPQDFPDLVVTQLKPGASTDPLYLNIGLSGITFAAKLDNNGVPIFYKRETYRVIDVKKHPTGQISYSILEDSGFAGVTQIVYDANYQETDRLKAVGLNNTDNHEFLILPNGNYVFLSYERTIRDLTPFGGEEDVEIEESIFQEVSPDMQVLFQWSSWDHLDYAESYYAFGTQDYAHANSIFVDDDDNWLVSFRGYSQVLKIHRTTGDVMWRFGGLSNEFTFINDPQNGTCGQHAASRLANGHIMIFDNGQTCDPQLRGTRNGDNTRVVEYAVDEEAKTAELVWSYHRPGFVARSQGSAQRLDNGNTMIGWGNGPSALATEVDANGEVVFELEARPTSGRAECYRARRFAD